MRIKNINGILFLLLFYFPVFSQQDGINIQADNTSLNEIITQLETKHNYLFSFKKEDVENIQVSLKTEKNDINSLLQELLKDTGLDFEIVSNNYIILKKSKASDTNYLSSQENVKTTLPFFCGSVVDSLTQRPLAYASIYFKKTSQGNYSSPDGSFNFRSDFSKNDTVVVSYVGYEEKHFTADYFLNNPCPKVQLKYYDFGEDFIVVTDYLTDGIDLGDNGAATILRPNRIGALPGQAEPDIFTTIQFLPGINSPRGESSNFNVRGGAADQNLLLWEGIPIYHASHYFGMISAFNPYIIDKIKVYRGGFGPEYGGRASCVIDMESAGLELKESEFGAGINFLNAYTHGKVLSPNKKLSFVYSLRRSISEIWRSPTFENISDRNLQNVLNVPALSTISAFTPIISDAFNFFDSHYKLSAQLTDRDEISGSFFYANNNFDDKISDIKQHRELVDILDLKSNGASFSWEHKWNKKFSSEILGVTTLYDYDYNYEINWTSNITDPTRSGHKFNHLKEKQLHFSNKYVTDRNHTIKFGYQFINYNVAFEINHDKGDQQLSNQNQQYNSNTNAFYGEFSSSQFKKTGIDIGFRLNEYEKRNKSYFSPRLRLWHNLTDEWRLQFNAGKHYQFVSQLVEFKGDFSGIETPIWVMANDREVPVLDATQFQLGAIYNKNAWVVDLQLFAKKLNGLTSLATGFDPTPRSFDIGSSSSRGMDILIKKRWKDFRVWGSYSLSQTDYSFPTFIVDSDFPAPFDQRHVFNFASQLKSGRFQFSLGFYLASGTPFSEMSEIRIEDVMDQQVLVPRYRDFNNQSLPVQHHLDASILYNFKSGKNNSNLKGVVGLSFFNIYNQENIYDREYFIDNPPGNGIMDAAIGIDDKTALGFTPNAVLRLEW